MNSMLVIRYSIDGVESVQEFAKTNKGTSASIKFLEGLRKRQLNHGWFYRLAEIENLTAKLNGFKSSRSKKKIETEVALNAAQKDRQELLDLLGITGPPELLKVEIFKN